LSPAEIVVHVMYYTHPACPWSWAAEPCLRRIEAEFGDGVSITYVMGRQGPTRASRVGLPVGGGHVVA
jgi:predicted DsbA family dithiol-disulfide isomerase